MKKLKLSLPKLKKMSDIRDYILLIEMLELQKLDNTVSVKTKMANQQETISSLKMIKNYYGQLTDFIAQSQARNRQDELEEALMKELAEFTHFWEQTMLRFKQLSRDEMKKLISSNRDLVLQVNPFGC